MSAYVDATVEAIDRRLGELQDELSRLEAARRALAETGPKQSSGRGRRRPSGQRRASPSASAATRGRKTTRSARPSRRSGGRSAQALSLVQERPGITIAELAEAMKIHPNYLYRVMPALLRDAKVKRDGKGWHAV